MTRLTDLLDHHVANGPTPGAVAMLATGDDLEIRAVGLADVEREQPMTRESIFRIASMTKPITAAAVMLLVEDGRLSIDEPVAEWLPELAAPMVVRTPSSPVDDVVPAERPITVRHLLTNTAGYGFPSDFSLPQVERLFTVQPDGRLVQSKPPPDAWIAALAEIPLLYQPGEAWLYDACSDLQGLLVARASGQLLPDVFAERIFAPLGMADTGFVVGPDRRSRLTSSYRRTEDGLELADGPDGRWTSMPAFPSGAGGLVCTVDDWHRFARMLLADGKPLLRAESVRQMTSDQVSASQRASGALFLDGQSWGFGGAVDVDDSEPWNVPGRYGWEGGTGTSGRILPSRGVAAILLTQLEVSDPTVPAILRDFWTLAADT